ncbi:MAG: hypothetical protein IIA50_04225 [Bacteroidetes bacterium]|nr:hypothetical protein [Bacteroidota bacterium]
MVPAYFITGGNLKFVTDEGFTELGYAVSNFLGVRTSYYRCFSMEEGGP